MSIDVLYFLFVLSCRGFGVIISCIFVPRVWHDVLVDGHCWGCCGHIGGKSIWTWWRVFLLSLGMCLYLVRDS